MHWPLRRQSWRVQTIHFKGRWRGRVLCGAQAQAFHRFQKRNMESGRVRRKQEFVCYRVNLTDDFERANIPGTEFLSRESEVTGRQPDPLPREKHGKGTSVPIHLDLLLTDGSLEMYVGSVTDLIALMHPVVHRGKICRLSRPGEQRGLES